MPDIDTTAVAADVAAAIDELVTAGAEWEIRADDGTIVRWEPLARAWRQEPGRLVVRPLEDARQLDDGRWVFLLNDSRPSYLDVGDARILPSGSVGVRPVGFDGFAVIRPVSVVHAETLARWDNFHREVLTDEERSEVDSLVLGEWYGRWA